MLSSEITLSKNIDVEIRDKFSKFIDTKSLDFYNFIDENGNILAKSSIEDYYKTVSTNQNIHKVEYECYYVLLPNIKAIIDKTKFAKNKKFKNVNITPIIIENNNIQNISGVNLTIPKDTKFKITYIKMGNILSSKCGVKIKISDCPIKALNGVVLDLPTSFMDNFKLEQV